MTSIRIYVEGGGDDRQGRRKLREGFGAFLREIRDSCRTRRIRFDVIACGAREAAYHHFCDALDAHRDALCVLLVDSEASVAAAHRPRAHLHQIDGWSRLDGVTDDQCHLMVQLMESWLIADPDALAAFYGQGFQRSALPANPNVEMIEKSRVESALQKATEKTQKKRYHKIQHGSELLQRVDPARVRLRAPHCDRLFVTLKTLIEGA